ncbi:MAG: aminotransferase class I/II-fold pyridoxal phosphate-dependent enzyme [Mariprofundaceae bacterium]|nr:aminotransferase class I/II-fold pyridoxal phosphate-dependent enzyme [Mariprofundaceae bacterium]
MGFETCPHGGGVEAAARRWCCNPDDVLDLSTGLHPAGPPAWLGTWLQQQSDLIGRYPDAHGEPARTALAKAFAVPAANVLMIAGAQAMIEIIFHAMSWQSLAIRTPCYREPLRCAQRAGCHIRSYAMYETIPAADAVWMTSPSNPFGDQQALPLNRGGVLDESYMAFAQRRNLGLLPQWVRLGSLTKTFCIPGLRLGYVIAESRTIEALMRWLPPWPATTLGLHLLPLLLPEADERDRQLQQGCQRLDALLLSHGWQTHRSAASFVLGRPPHPLPDPAKHRLLLREFPEWPALSHSVRLGIPAGEIGWQRLKEYLKP